MNSSSVDKFHIWTKDNTFRTSYNDMRFNVFNTSFKLIFIFLYCFEFFQKPELPKNYAVPGY